MQVISVFNSNQSKSIYCFYVSGVIDPYATYQFILSKVEKTPEDDYPYHSKNGRYFVQTWYLRLSLDAILGLFMKIITPSSFKHEGNQTLYVKTGKLKNKIPVTLRTRSRHGPTLEINLKYPTPTRQGEILKLRIANG